MADNIIQPGIKTVTGSLRGFVSEDLEADPIENVSLTFTSSDDNWYETTITAPNMSSYNFLNGKFDIQVMAETQGGNRKTINSYLTEDENLSDQEKSLLENLYLQVKEKDKPTINITSSQDVYNGTPIINFTISDITDEEKLYKNSGIDKGKIAVQLVYQGEEKNDKQETIIDISKDDIRIIDVTTANYGQSKTTVFSVNCSYERKTSLNNTGYYDFIITATDNDGNFYSLTKQIYVDITVPEISIQGLGSVTNNKNYTVSGNYDKDDVKELSAKIILLDADGNETESQKTYKHEDFVLVDDTYSIVVELFEGINKIIITGIDSGGNSGSAQGIITCDSSMPKFTNVEIIQNVVNTGDSITIRIQISTAENGN